MEKYKYGITLISSVIAFIALATSNFTTYCSMRLGVFSQKKEYIGNYYVVIVGIFVSEFMFSSFL